MHSLSKQTPLCKSQEHTHLELGIAIQLKAVTLNQVTLSFESMSSQQCGARAGWRPLLWTSASIPLSLQTATSTRRAGPALGPGVVFWLDQMPGELLSSERVGRARRTGADWGGIRPLKSIRPPAARTKAQRMGGIFHAASDGLLLSHKAPAAGSEFILLIELRSTWKALLNCDCI